MASRPILNILRPIVSLGLIIYLFSLIDWNRLTDLLGNCHVVYLFFPPLLFSAGLIIASVRWKVVLYHFNIFADIASTIKCYVSFFFYNVFLPGVIGGDFIRTAMCAKQTKKPLRLIINTVLFERASGFLALFIMGSAASFFLPEEIVHGVGNNLIEILLLSTTALLIFFAVLPAVSERVLKRIIKKKAGILVNLENLIFSIKQLSAGPVLKILTLSSLFQSMDIISTFFIAKSLNIMLPVSFFFCHYAVYLYMYRITCFNRRNRRQGKQFCISADKNQR